MPGAGVEYSMGSPISCVGKPARQDILYPDERHAKRQLLLAFPDIDADLLDEFSFSVSVRRQTIDDAINTLTEMDRNKTDDTKTADTNNNCRDNRIVKTSDNSKPKLPPSILKGASERTFTTKYAPRRKSSTHDSGSSGTGEGSSCTQTSPPPQNPLFYASNTDDATGIAVLFITTMTGDRRVRDHCRQIETLLYLKRVQYKTINLADNPMLQRRLRDMYAASTGLSNAPPAPAFFIGRHFVGDYEKLQDLEDDGVLMETLSRMGYHERPEGVEDTEF